MGEILTYRRTMALAAVVCCLVLWTCNREATNGGEPDHDFIEIVFKSHESQVIGNPRLKVLIYGYDPNLSGAPASVIVEDNLEATELPFTARIRIPEDPVSLIDPLRDEQDARYYLNLEWDSDGNGDICGGDITIDYNTNIPNIDIESRDEQVIYLTRIPESSQCN